VKLRQKITYAILTLGMVVSFQNCGKGFQPVSADAFSSAQCSAKMRAEASTLHLSPSELNCADFNAYACERRIFSPDTVDLSETVKECVPNSQICVDVDVRQFNTTPARAAASADQFQPGGDYNHEEVHCYHRMVYHGLSLFDASADSLEASLAKAMAACEQAVGS
jgi:hypothetical protein